MKKNTIIIFGLIGIGLYLYLKNKKPNVTDSTVTNLPPQTPDNSLNGDAGFQTSHNPSWFSKVQWLWRNPFYGFAVKYLHGTDGMSYSGDLHCDESHPGHLLVKGNGLFQYVLFKPMFGKVLYLNLGWNIKALTDPSFVNDPNNAAFIADYPATFAFSPRLV